MRASSRGPKESTVARTGMPGPSPPRARNSTGKAAGSHGIPVAVVRSASL